jgi:hypothetical protein
MVVLCAWVVSLLAAGSRSRLARLGLREEQEVLGMFLLSPAADAFLQRLQERKKRRRMQELVGKIARVIGGEAGDAEKRAWNVVALMVGAISVARALPKGPEAQALLDAALQQAAAVIDGAEAT